MKVIEVMMTKPVEIDGKSYTELTFSTIADAKKFIKANIDIYKSSAIYKIYANGDMVNLGSLDIKGINKKFVANTQQKTMSYA